MTNSTDTEMNQTDYHTLNETPKLATPVHKLVLDTADNGNVNPNDSQFHQNLPPLASYSLLKVIIPDSIKTSYVDVRTGLYTRHHTIIKDSVVWCRLFITDAAAHRGYLSWRCETLPEDVTESTPLASINMRLYGDDGKLLPLSEKDRVFYEFELVLKQS